MLSVAIDKRLDRSRGYVTLVTVKLQGEQYAI